MKKNRGFTLVELVVVLVIIQIFHTDKGKMVALNFAKDGYMVTMIEGKETTCITFAYDCSDRLWAYNT